MTSQTKWERITGPLGGVNYILRGDGFYVSYNGNPGASLFGRFFDSDEGGPETALVHDDDFHILNGDYRADYERLAPDGFDACKRFYDATAAHANSSWSTSKPAA